MKITQFPTISCLLVISLLFAQLRLWAQNQPLNSVNWTTFDTIKELKKSKPKPILVFFYKPEDDSSQLMLNTTLSNKDICAFINSKFYAVKFDIESEADVNFLDDKVYKKDPLKPYHDLSKLLLGELPVTPTLILYDDKAAGFSFNGYKNQYDMLCILVYIAESVEKTTRYDIWATDYFKTFPPAKMQKKVPLGIHWLSLDDALKLNKETPKKIFLTWFTKWNASSTVFLFNALNHPKVAEYMNQNFYCVKLDAQTTDTLIWDKTFVNQNQPHHFHQMAISMMNGKFLFPSYFYFDSQNKIIINVKIYLDNYSFYLLLHFLKITP